MWLSTRFKFRRGDAGWEDYVRFIGLPQLTEVRSVDSALNKYVEPFASAVVQSFAQAQEAMRTLPVPSSSSQYRLLYLDAEGEIDWPGLRLLGHDLSDETRTSSLLNCGPWTGKLAELTTRLNGHGLLSFEDAVNAKAVLPIEWPGEPHARVTIWKLYEVTPA